MLGSASDEQLEGAREHLSDQVTDTISVLAYLILSEFS